MRDEVLLIYYITFIPKLREKCIQYWLIICVNVLRNVGVVGYIVGFHGLFYMRKRFYIRVGGVLSVCFFQMFWVFQAVYIPYTNKKLLVITFKIKVLSFTFIFLVRYESDLVYNDLILYFCFSLHMLYVWMLVFKGFSND